MNRPAPLLTLQQAPERRANVPTDFHRQKRRV